jgi:tetratricopeptide (TPR) repeat protein
MYEQALRARPRDWTLMGEIAEFLLRHVGDYEAGRKMAETALSMNPWYSVWLWNLLGDSLYALNRFSEAHEIYLKANELGPGDVRTALNLGYTYRELGSPAQALQALARGLVEDGSGQFRNRLLEKQAQILAELTQSFERRQEWLARRAARMAAG